MLESKVEGLVGRQGLLLVKVTGRNAGNNTERCNMKPAGVCVYVCEPGVPLPVVHQRIRECSAVR